MTLTVCGQLWGVLAGRLGDASYGLVPGASNLLHWRLLPCSTQLGLVRAAQASYLHYAAASTVVALDRPLQCCLQ